MKGTKAAALARWAEEAGRAFVRFDYSGHGESGGAFTDGTIGRWLADALAVFDACCRGPQILVGSSMGGWLALLMVRALRRRPSSGPASVAGLVLIAPAVDFTEELMWKRFTPAIKRELEETGVWARPSDYSSGALSRHPAIDRGGPQSSPPRRHDRNRMPGAHPARRRGSRRAVAACGRAGSRLASDDVVLTLVKDGDHRLSRPEDIERLIRAVAEF